MLSKSSREFLGRLMNSSGPSGFEAETASVFRKYLEGFADSVETDIIGNTISVLNPEADFKVMMAGHYDEIGFQVVHISDEGLLYFRNVGGVDKVTVPGTEVDVLTTGGRVPGVVGKKPIHLQESKEREKIFALKDLWIDIGCESGKEAGKTVRIGDPVAVRSNFEYLGKNRIRSKGMDDKIGAFVVAETMRALSRKKLSVAVYGVGTVQEELGLRGATTSAFGIGPDIGFGIDVDFATDTPDIDNKQAGDVSLGKGPVITRSADNNVPLGEFIVKTARKAKIPFQETAGFRSSGGTDTAQIQMTRSGVATALISIPSRYMHTPVEICDIRDVENAVKLLTAAIYSLKGDEKFIPGLR